ncbi:hypothetical protein MAR_007459, partial [Mya arenaria]
AFLKLYPFVNKTGNIPIGHPQVITEIFKDISLYEGLIKCKVLAPRLHIPVLPMKCNGELMFNWAHKDDFIEASARTNDIIAAYTTSQDIAYYNVTLIPSFLPALLGNGSRN